MLDDFRSQICYEYFCVTEQKYATKILQTGRRIQTDSSTWEFFYPNNYFSCEAIFSYVVAKFKLLTSLPLSLPWAALSEWSTGFPKSDWYFFSTINNSFQEIINYVLSSTYSIWEWNLSKPMTTLWPARKKQSQLEFEPVSKLSTQDVY